MSEKMTTSEDLIYQLQTLASHEPEDLDNPEVEVAYENDAGAEGFLTVCCIDLAARVLVELEAKEQRIAELEGAIQAYEDNGITKNKFAMFDLLMQGE